jgi:hypothetical protein
MFTGLTPLQIHKVVRGNAARMLSIDIPAFQG